MKKPRVIFFDLDHTLWDFDANCAETLQELYQEHALHLHEIHPEEFVSAYRATNDHMWQEYHFGRITKEEIRNTRFQRTFSRLKVDESLVPQGIDIQFLERCPAKPHVFPHTHDVLDYLLDAGYTLFVLTNGFKETQHLKMSHARLTPYFKEVIHAEEVGYLKPDARIYHYALSLAGLTDPEEALMIGDDWYADYQGARSAGLPAVWFNPHAKVLPEEGERQIHSLLELKTFL